MGAQICIGYVRGRRGTGGVQCLRYLWLKVSRTGLEARRVVESGFYALLGLREVVPPAGSY